MGLRTGAIICQRTTSGVIHIMEKEGYGCENYLDNFVEHPASAEKAFYFLAKLLEELGLVEKDTKAIPPDTVVDSLSILFDTMAFTMSVTHNRLIEIKDMVKSWHQRTKATKKQLQSLVGKLLFVAKCVLLGRIFVSRLLDVLRHLEGHNPSFEVEPEMIKDLNWWDTFIDHYNGISMIPQAVWAKPDSVIATNACLGGVGGINLQRKELFHFTFPQTVCEQNHHIDTLELACLTVAVKLWVHT